MEAVQEYEQAWQAYQQALQALYQPRGKAGETARGFGELAPGLDLDERSAAVLTRSEDVRQALARSLQIEEGSQRELAALKLLAAAAYDLAVAQDLLEREEEEVPADTTRSAPHLLLAAQELRIILDAPLATGIQGLVPVERALLPTTSKAARAQLQATITTTLQIIPDETAGLCQMAVGGLIMLGLAPIQGVASVGLQELLAHIPQEASSALCRAARFVVEAAQKLWTALGKEQEQQTQEQIAIWSNELQSDRDVVTSWVEKVYETKRIREEVTALLDSAPTGIKAGPYNQATQALEALMVRYEKTKTTLTWLMRILALLKTALLSVPPWGPTLVYSTYGGVLAYATTSGGASLEWYRLGGTRWMSRSAGLRTIVRQSVIPAGKDRHPQHR